MNAVRRFFARLTAFLRDLRQRLTLMRLAFLGRAPFDRRERTTKGTLFYRPGMKPPKGYALNGRGDLINLRREFARRGGTRHSA